MSTEEKVEHLKNAAGFIALFKGSTKGIDKVIADLLCEPYHTPKQYEGDSANQMQIKNKQ